MQPQSGSIETQQGIDVLPDMFSPFFPEGPRTQARSTGTVLSFAATATSTAVAADASANPDGNGSGGDDYAELLAALATQQPTGTWGASGGESYMLEENDVGVLVPSAVGAWVPNQDAMRRYVMGA
jgi:hypothetical protein